MRITRFLTDLVETVGTYIPFIGSSPPDLTQNSNMKHKKPTQNSSPPKGKGKRLLTNVKIFQV